MSRKRNRSGEVPQSRAQRFSTETKEASKTTELIALRRCRDRVSPSPLSRSTTTQTSVPSGHGCTSPS